MLANKPESKNALMNEDQVNGTISHSQINRNISPKIDPLLFKSSAP